MVRAKFTLSHIRDQQLSWSKGQADESQKTSQKFLCFHTTYDSSLPEDQRFMLATPSGSIEMQVDNPEALKQFEIGKAYYIDFTPAS